ncbi:MAG: hypothetical protein ABFC98_05730, partial [Candidatus Cloacimonas sp.]
MSKAISLETIIYIPTFDEIYEDWKQTPREAGSTTTYSTPSTQTTTQDNKPEPGQAFTETEQKQANTPTCPFGGIFGADCEKISFCGRCSVWDACSAKRNETAPTQTVAQTTPVQTTAPVQETKPVETAPEQTAAPIARRRRG